MCGRQTCWPNIACDSFVCAGLVGGGLVEEDFICYICPFIQSLGTCSVPGWRLKIQRIMGYILLSKLTI